MVISQIIQRLSKDSATVDNVAGEHKGLVLMPIEQKKESRAARGAAGWK